METIGMEYIIEFVHMFREMLDFLWIDSFLIWFKIEWFWYPLQTILAMSFIIVGMVNVFYIKEVKKTNSEMFVQLFVLKITNNVLLIFSGYVLYKGIKSVLILVLGLPY